MIPAIILITLISAVSCNYLAKRRGANPVFWTMMGVVFGPFAIPFVFLGKRFSQQQ